MFYSLLFIYFIMWKYCCSMTEPCNHTLVLVSRGQRFLIILLCVGWFWTVTKCSTQNGNNTILEKHLIPGGIPYLYPAYFNQRFQKETAFACSSQLKFSVSIKYFYICTWRTPVLIRKLFLIPRLLNTVICNPISLRKSHCSRVTALISACL